MTPEESHSQPSEILQDEQKADGDVDGREDVPGDPNDTHEVEDQRPNVLSKGKSQRQR